MKKQFGVLVTLAAVAMLSACGGSSSGPSTESSVSGIVADGYLENATVCFDTPPFNKVCDADENPVKTDGNGVYVLSGSNPEQYPILVEVVAGVTKDSDSGVVTEDYILSAPAAAPEFVSPLTTLVQQQLELDSSKTLEQIVADLQETLEVSVPLLGSSANFMENKSDTEDNDFNKLHRVAQVVASIMGGMQDEIENGGIAPANTAIEEIVALVAQEVMLQLAVIEEAAADPATFDPTTISGTVVSSISVTAENYTEKVQAVKPAELASFQAMMEGDGVHWIDSGYSSGSGYVNGHLEYGIVTAPAGAAVMSGQEKQWDSVAGGWVAMTEGSDYYLVDGQWVLSADDMSKQAIAYNADQSATTTNSETGYQEKVRIAVVDIAGHKMSGGLDGVALLDDSLTYPADSKAYRLTFEALTYQYEVWNNEGLHYWTPDGIVEFTRLAEVQGHYAFGGDSYLYLDEYEVQFAVDGVLKVFVWDNNAGAYQALADGSYAIETVQEQSLLMLNLPGQGSTQFLIEWSDSTVKQGEFTAAGSSDSDGDLFSGNKVAFDALLANLNQTGVYQTWGYVQGRNYETTSKNKTSLIIGYQPNGTSGGTPLAIDSVEFPQTASDTAAALTRTTQYNEATYYIDCRGTDCIDRGLTMDTYLAASYPGVEFAASADYKFYTDTTAGSTLTTTVDYPGHVDLPFISSSSIAIPDVAGGGKLVSWTLPTGETNWDQVDELRLKFADPDSGLVVVFKLAADADEFALSVAEVAMMGANTTLTFETRAYNGKVNYARGLSNSVQVFGGSAAAPITGFSTESLSGLTLYNAFEDSDATPAVWRNHSFEFADSTYIANSGSSTGTWSVDANAVLMLNDSIDGTSYVKVANSSAERLDICWSDSLAGVDSCSVGNEYFYYDGATAQSFVDAQ